MKKIIYLDNASTAPLKTQIIKNVLERYEQESQYANTSSTHTLGKEADKRLNEVRNYIAQIIGVEKVDIIFTSGASEGNTTIINTIKQKINQQSKINEKIMNILLTNIEHPSIEKNIENLASELSNIEIRRVKVLKSGKIDLEDLKNKVDENTIFVTVMGINNETGTMQPIEEIGHIIREEQNRRKKESKDNSLPIYFHSDMVQMFGKCEIDVQKMNLDYITVSSHKLGGLGSFGFIYARNIDIQPIIYGGEQEKGKRAGTTDILAAEVLFEILKEYHLENQKIFEMATYLKTRLEEEKLINNLQYELNTEDINSSGIINIYFPNMEAQRLITYLDTKRIYISASSACSAGSLNPSKVITEMYDEERAKKSVRISISRITTKEELNELVNEIAKYEKKIKERNKNG